MRVETIGDATLYLGDCREIMPTLGPVDAVVTDPPYGINYSPHDRHINAIDYGGKIVGDNTPFSPSSLLGFKNVILWGGNNFATELPIGGWIVWDKRLSIAADKILGSPFELAWSSNPKMFKMVRLLHGGAKNADAKNGDVANAARFHPTQKPVELIIRCITFLPKGADRVLDPYMGSGTTGVACANLGRKFIGIEIDEDYFNIACERISAAYAQGRLFD